MKPYYEDDYVTLYHGDALEVGEWLAAHVLVTDPPYGIAWSRGENKARASASHAGIVGDADTSLRDNLLLLWEDKPGIVFGSLYAPFPANLRHVLIWQKPNDAGVVGSTTGFRRDLEAIFLTGLWQKQPVRYGSVLRSRTPMIGGTAGPGGRTGHPHAKPLDLMAQLIANAPTGVITDPTCGSGSTLVAAKSLGRRCIGVEIEERYCEIAARRLSQEVLDFGEAS